MGRVLSADSCLVAAIRLLSGVVATWIAKSSSYQGCRGGGSSVSYTYESINKHSFTGDAACTSAHRYTRTERSHVQRSRHTGTCAASRVQSRARTFSRAGPPRRTVAQRAPVTSARARGQARRDRTTHREQVRSHYGGRFRPAPVPLFRHSPFTHTAQPLNGPVTHGHAHGATSLNAPLTLHARGPI